MWKLKFDDKEILCSIEKRPSIDIEEVEMIDQHGNSHWTPGKASWLPLRVKLTSNAALWNGSKDVKLSLYDEEDELEEWTLKDSVATAIEEDVEISFSGCDYLLR